eukprot:5082609-Prymnesium_polylepis.2
MCALHDIARHLRSAVPLARATTLYRCCYHAVLRCAVRHRSPVGTGRSRGARSLGYTHVFTASSRSALYIDIANESQVEVD